ncbi:SpoIID/LytB domain-containing protein [Aminipila luticellarii]|nr:SpoIID/LytB domain-containing protein [Aminipila luticellarii]
MEFTVKRFLSIAIACIVIITAYAAFSVSCADASTMPEYIRIGLKYGSSSAGEYEMTFDGGVRLGMGSNEGFTELTAFPDVNRVLIRLESGNIQLIGTKNSGETVILNEGQTNANCLMPYDNDGLVGFGSSQYRGGILFNSTSGKLTIINLLPVEEYLYGVINAELSKSYPEEALKAQAVAARSYAVCNLGNHKSYGFDLCATTHCQVYKGYTDEYPETVHAVDATRGETIQYNGETVNAFFYKNSGGYTQDSQDVWGGNVGYLKAVKDEYSPAYSWSQSFTFAELSSKLASAGYNVGNVTTVSITKRNQSGAVETLQFTGTGGTAVLQKDKIRSVLGSSLIKSTMFSMGEAETVQPSEDKTSTAYGFSKGINRAAELPETIYAVNKNGAASPIAVKDVYVHNGKTTKLQQQASGGSQISNTLESVSGGNVTFTGLGYGHGVGMPQDSAVEMAKKGFTYEDILKYYYTDISIH